MTQAVNDARASTPTANANDSLRITEIFLSLQGETSLTGLPTVFVRLTGCPLRCEYCDTAYAFSGGKLMAIDEIVEAVQAYEVDYVTVTGGEPLAQANCHTLLTSLCDRGKRVSLETSGAMDIAEVDPRVQRIVDVKTPGSNEQSRNRWENMPSLTASDQIKFVLCDRRDYDWACTVLKEHDFSHVGEVLFSPSHEELDPAELAGWILADRLPVRMQIQLHKYLWGNEPGR